MTPPGILRTALLVARKDLLIEFRTRSAFLSAVVFAVLAVAIFYFAWKPAAVSSLELAPGVMWVVFTFAGLLGVQRAFAIEQAERAVDGLLLAPVEREALYLGKLMANIVFIGAVQAVTIPALAIFYNLPLGRALPVFFGVALLATVGLAAVGTLFAAMAVNTRMAELLLPVLSLPFFVPIIITAAMSSTRLLAGQGIADVMPWLRILVAFDLVFVTACMFAFPHTIEE
jgi:heme exporter protein B